MKTKTYRSSFILCSTLCGLGACAQIAGIDPPTHRSPPTITGTSGGDSDGAAGNSVGGAGGIGVGSSSNGGMGGAAGAASTGGGNAMGGNGGSVGTGGMGGAGGMGGSPVCPDPGTVGSCGTAGCPACPALVMIATGASSSKTSTFVSANGWTSAANLANVSSADAPALAIRTGKGSGIALYRNSAVGSEGIIRYSTWDAANGFGIFTDMNSPSPAFTRATPAVVASADAVHVAFLGIGVDYKYHYASFDGTSFNPSDELVKDAATMALGYCTPGLALLGPNAAFGLTLISPGYGDESLYGRSRSGGTWDAGFKFATIPLLVDDVSPAIVALNSGPELLVVFTEKVATKPLYSLTRVAGAWSNPVMLPGTSSVDVTLLALASGGAILAYRDYTTNAMKWSRFDGSNWSAVTDVSAGLTAKSKPALALGAGDAEAELLFVDATGNAQHARLRKGATNFDTPVPIAGATGLVGIAAATNL